MLFRADSEDIAALSQRRFPNRPTLE